MTKQKPSKNYWTSNIGGYFVVTRAPGAKKGEKYYFSHHKNKRNAKKFLNKLKKNGAIGIITKKAKSYYRF